MVENVPFPYILRNFCQAHGYKVLTHFYIYLHFSVSEFEHLFTYFLAVCICAYTDSLFIISSFENIGLLCFPSGILPF